MISDETIVEEELKKQKSARKNIRFEATEKMKLKIENRQITKSGICREHDLRKRQKLGGKLVESFKPIEKYMA